MSGVSRRPARVLAMQTLYALEMGCGTVADAVSASLDGASLPSEQKRYGVRLIELVLEGREELRTEIGKVLAHWDYDRVAVIDRLLLEIALVEIKNVAEVPPKVVLAEYRSIAKKYSTEESPRFVGGMIHVLMQRYVNLESLAKEE